MMELHQRRARENPHHGAEEDVNFVRRAPQRRSILFSIAVAGAIPLTMLMMVFTVRALYTCHGDVDGQLQLYRIPGPHEEGGVPLLLPVCVSTRSHALDLSIRMTSFPIGYGAFLAARGRAGDVRTWVWAAVVYGVNARPDGIAGTVQNFGMVKTGDGIVWKPLTPPSKVLPLNKRVKIRWTYSAKQSVLSVDGENVQQPPEGQLATELAPRNQILYRDFINEDINQERWGDRKYQRLDGDIEGVSYEAPDS